MISVANKRGYAGTRNGAYVGRPSPLGNPFKIGRDGDRDAVIARYAAWLDTRLADPDSAQSRELSRLRALWRQAGVLTLWCWCAPLACHADVIKARLETRP